MSSFTGTGALTRLVLRRDRIKLPVWIIGIVGMLAVSCSAVVNLYSTQESQVNYAITSAASMVSHVLAGPMSGVGLGPIIMMETYLFVAVLVAFMSTLAVVRHTRQNEETGRLELIGSSVVGRYANMTATLLVVGAANVVVGLLCTFFLATILSDEPISGAIAYGASMVGVGFVFMAVGVVAAQLTEGSRAANGIAAAVIGVTFLIRGLGDALGEVTANGTVVVSHWLSWLSPFGWGMLMQPYVKNAWWVLGLFAALTLVLAWVARMLLKSRDMGAGVFPPRKGPARATPHLLGVFGLARRLQRGVFIGWLVTIVIAGVSYGAVAKEFESFFAENEQLTEAFTRSGAASITDGLFAALMAITGVMLASYLTQALMRMRSEETGSLEPVLGTAVSRVRWMLSHISYGFVAAALLALLAGVLAALTYGVITNDISAQLWPVTQAALVQIPAMFVIGGFGVLMFALLPQFAVALTWSAVVFSLLIVQLGILLKLPQWVMNISPFTHVPAAPAEPITYLPLVILSAIALGLTLLGLAIFRRRDIAPN